MGKEKKMKKWKEKEASITASRQNRRPHHSPGQSGVRKPERKRGSRRLWPGGKGDENADLSDIYANDEHPEHVDGKRCFLKRN